MAKVSKNTVTLAQVISSLQQLEQEGCWRLDGFQMDRPPVELPRSDPFEVEYQPGPNVTLTLDLTNTSWKLQLSS